MRFLELPPEILLHIGRQLTGERSLAFLARTCCYLYPLLNELLYSRLVRNGGGPGLLIWAAKEGSAGTVCRLLDKGISIESKAGDGATPLLAASLGKTRDDDCEDLCTHVTCPTKSSLKIPEDLQRQYETVELLLQRGADVTADGQAILFCACNTNNPRLIPLLVKYGANLEAIDEEGVTPLQWAVKSGFTVAVRSLLESGADVHARKKKPWEIIGTMRKLWEEQLAKKKLQKAEQPGGNRVAESDDEVSDWEDEDEFEQVMLDAGYGHDEIEEDFDINDFPFLASQPPEQQQQMLRSRAEEKSRRRKLGDTPLHRAAKRSNQAILKLLLSHGADPAVGNKYGHTPLHSACIASNLASAQILITIGGADVNSLDSAGHSPLHRAVGNGRTGSERSFEQGFDEWIRPKHNIQKCSSDLIQFLLDNGAGIESRTKSNWNMTEMNGIRDEEPAGLTPLQVAVFHGNEAAARVFLERGADVMARSKMDGRMALHFAAAMGNAVTVRLMLEYAGGEEALESKDGINLSTPLLLAAGMVYDRVTEHTVKVLIECGADMNARDARGVTPLIAACSAYMPEVHTIKILLKAGTRVDDAADDGRTTALLAACEKGHAEIVEVLVEAGADVRLLGGEFFERLNRWWGEGTAGRSTFELCAAKGKILRILKGKGVN